MTNKEQLNQVMAEFIIILKEERDAWGPETDVAKVLNRHLDNLDKEIQVHHTISLNKGEK